MGAFNGSGTFVRSYSWVTDAANGVNITASRFDTEDNGFASGLTNCITRDGQGIPTAAIAWGNQNLTGVNALGAATFTFTGNGTVGGTLGVTGNATLTANATIGGTLGVTGNTTLSGTLGVTGFASFTGGLVGYNPNAGTTGGVRIAGNATSGDAILQFVDNTLASQWGYLLTTSAGNFTLSGGLTVNGNLTATGTGTFTGGLVTGTSISDGQGSPAQRLIGYRALPFTAASAGRTLALTDVGMCIPATGTINIPTNASVAFAIGDIAAVYNNSGSSISITASGGVTLRLGGSATTGTRALAQRGLATLLKVGTDEWVALNGGVS